MNLLFDGENYHRPPTDFFLYAGVKGDCDLLDIIHDK